MVASRAFCVGGSLGCTSLRGRRTAGGSLLVAVAALGVVGVASCTRLNPDWCDEKSICPVGQQCDRRFNRCVLLPDLGPAASDARSDAALPDRGPAVRDLQPTMPCHLDSATSAWLCHQGHALACSLGPRGIRACPAGRCASGHCQAPAPTIKCKVSGECNAGQRCTLLRDFRDEVHALCAEAVAGSDGPAPCLVGLQCATGLCTHAGYCFTACDAGRDCASGRCDSVPVYVEGLTIWRKSCAP